MDHSGSNTTTAGMEGMSMGDGGSGSGPAFSMLWNWNTVDTCFLADSWHVRTRASFAGSVIGVFFLVIAIEAVRRGMRDYDRYLTRRVSVVSTGTVSPDTKIHGGVDGGSMPTLAATSCAPARYTPGWRQQLLRSLAYGSQFTASFLVMLLGMYYNGYILLAIFIGHTVGYAIFGRDTCGALSPEGTGSERCC